MDEVSGIADQLPLQLCVLGDSLAKDANFLNICKAFQVRKPLICLFNHNNPHLVGAGGDQPEWRRIHWEGVGDQNGLCP